MRNEARLWLYLGDLGYLAKTCKVFQGFGNYGAGILLNIERVIWLVQTSKG